MRTTVPCPLCHHTLTFIARLGGLACPFCRAEIEDSDGKIVIGEKVRCQKCGGAFTAQSPPPAVRLFASAPEPCPTCQLVLAIRHDLPPGKKVRCYRCGTKFQPRRENAGEAAPGAATCRHAGDAPNGESPHLPMNGAPPEAPALPYVPANGHAHANPDLAGHEHSHVVGGHEAKSKTKLGQRAPRSSITQLAPAIPEEAPPPTADAASTPGPSPDDEVDIFSTDRSSRGELPEKPTRRETPERPAPMDAPDKGVRAEARPPSDPEKKALPDRLRQENAPAKLAPMAPPAPVQTVGHSAPPPTIRIVAPKKKPVGNPPAPKRRRVAPNAPTKRAPVPVGTLPGPAGFVAQTIPDAAATSEPPAPRVQLSAAEEESATVLLDASSEVEEIAQDDEVPVLLDEPSAPAFNAAPLFPPTPYRPSEPRRQSDDDAEPAPARTKFLVGTLAFLAVMACGYYFLFAPKPSRSRVYPTDGIVLFQGKPAVGARVTLFPEDKTAGRFLPTGIVGDDGTFKLTTYVPNDGAPAGRYRVGIVRGRLDGDELTELKKKNPPEVVEQILAEKAEDLLYSKYAKMDMTVEIPAPGKQLRFELE